MRIVHLEVDTWNDLPNKNCEEFLTKLDNREFDDKINYSEIWYDMAIIYCITTTEEFMKEHKVEELEVSEVYYQTTIFKNYYPQYNPNNLGCCFRNFYAGYEPEI